MDDKKAEFNHRGDRERSKGIDMLEEFRKKAVRNQGHLIEALR